VTFAERVARPVVAGLLWLVVFSALYTVGDEVGAWPTLPPGAFRNVELVAGFLAGIVVLFALAFPNRHRRPDNNLASET
jgi:hypothetical protein